MRFSRLLAASLILGGLSTGAHAQFLDRLLNRAERAAKGEIEAKVDRETRKVTRCALGDATCIRAARDRGEEVEVVGNQPKTPPNAPVRNGQIHFPMGAISFVDQVISYSPSARNAPPRALRERNNILGEPDHDSDGDARTVCSSHQSCPLVALGQGGRIELRFTDNVLTGSGDETADLWIFGAGPGARLTVEIGVDGEEWLPVGEVDGGSTGVDIDAYGFGRYTAFSYVRLIDISDEGDRSDPAGASIDAVGALSTRDAGQ